ncbi:hypothetical protein [Anthocerotibacter panamensis]|uniref:hypothetical protein n=1 Tax=Anthocerotibacter panamensis TaxID=2857077 RepID=UPI001C40641B|nr:hypothetical protein [Anthocerotibacter panamensis]
MSLVLELSLTLLFLLVWALWWLAVYLCIFCTGATLLLALRSNREKALAAVIVTTSAASVLTLLYYWLPDRSATASLTLLTQSNSWGWGIWVGVVTGTSYFLVRTLRRSIQP